MWFKDFFYKIKNIFKRKFSRGLDFHRRRRRIKAENVKRNGIYIGIGVGTVFLAFIICFTFFTTVKMGGVSMMPTIEDSTNLFINRASYLIGGPNYNHIIAFETVDDEDDYVYVKRVVALPGDTVKISGGKLYVNGEKYDDVADTQPIKYEGVAEKKITVDEGCYFVLGDNRNNSEDSRYQSLGMISKSQIKGKVWFKTSFGDFGIVN